MLNGIAGTRVNGVGVFLSVLYVVLAVISGCDDAHRSAFRGPDSVQLLAGGVCSIRGAVERPVDAHAPRLPGGVEAVAPDLADVHEHVLDADGVEVCGHFVAGVALGDGVEIERGILHVYDALRECRGEEFHSAAGEDGLDGVGIR